MGEPLERFSEALNSIYYLHNPAIKMDEALVLSLCDRILSKSETDQRRLSEIFEILSANDRHLELNSLGLAEVKERLTCLDQFNHGQRSAPYSRSHHLYLAKYTLLAKTVLLVCYHHGLSRDELAELRVSSLTVADEVVTLTTLMGATRPLFDLETAYHQTLEAWYRLRGYEEPQEYLFGAILKDGRLSPYPITASYSELARFVFLADTGCHQAEWGEASVAELTIGAGSGRLAVFEH
ncbi:hypothetical protein [Ketobacter sp. GenoA1]|uniref:hypothetical protein n=1 Tax=Ketobacter sp. GenoA1 TaxID=2072747 RepID=UPI000F24C357|nr:hypothetical protein [Ketobacter sp. GenoA1]RLT88014.1 MAG: hypothetical protein D9N13_19790 [Ketobacter sp. GenoA1]